MSLPLRILTRWVQLSALATALSLMVYVSAQQIGRQMADDPQVQIARDARDALASGAAAETVVPSAKVELTRSLSPWVTVLNDSGKAIASSATLNGQAAAVPSGVIDYVRTSGENRVTWQPQRGVRMATITVRVAGNPTRFVTAGRSLDETEGRIDKLGRLLLLGWLVTLAGLLVVVAPTEALLSKRTP
ncbi:MAG TPA: hypothetical protein VII02_14725 [Gemmatimonadaceae bacterium]